MKAIIIGLAGVAVLVSGTAYASKLVRGIDFAQVGIGDSAVLVSKVQDGDTTCYVTRHGKFGAHAISCVK